MADRKTRGVCVRLEASAVRERERERDEQKRQTRKEDGEGKGARAKRKERYAWDEEKEGLLLEAIARRRCWSQRRTRWRRGVGE